QCFFILMTHTVQMRFYNFICAFDYYPKYPREIGFDQIAYAKGLEKCVEDNFDYTIEKYGTIPSQKLGRPEVILD
ncbi:MAG: hypothetical protein LUF02_05460, partial [Erysipelotrichaceae bacterium]|nr:hypothetical protein [Erysipelotrichaceae bacterium]